MTEGLRVTLTEKEKTMPRLKLLADSQFTLTETTSDSYRNTFGPYCVQCGCDIDYLTEPSKRSFQEDTIIAM